MTSRSPDSLRRIPPVDLLLRHPEGERLAARYGRDPLLRALRRELDALRAREEGDALETSPERLLAACDAALAIEERRALRPVLNATGVVLHTNLGRAPLSAAAAEAAALAARRYLNLELDLETGERGRRGGRVEELLRRLTGAEDAIAVNNNAAAVLLALNSLCEGREAVVSRGELVEIGGSFRVPEILRKSGATLREVGTTNRTRAEDYRDAVGPRTGLLLKVHPSNYRIEGFTEEVPLEELVRIGRRAGLPVVYDLGSGALSDPAAVGLPDEPSAAGAVRTGADLVCFSGDKLAGGPQAGYAVGRREAVAALRRNPLYRALRLDKMSLAAAEATLDAHARGTAAAELPVLRMLAASGEALFERAERLAAALRARRPDLPVSTRPGVSRSGGGSAPEAALPTRLVVLEPGPGGAAALLRALRNGSPPVLARVHDERVLIDLRTVPPDEEPELLDALASLPRAEGL